MTTQKVAFLFLLKCFKEKVSLFQRGGIPNIGMTGYFYLQSKISNLKSQISQPLPLPQP